MIFRLNPSSGLPLYVQLIEQIKHALETGSLRVGEQLPSVRQMAEDTLINPNTVVRAYRELQHEGIIELRHGSGAFIRDAIAPRAKLMQKAALIVKSVFDRLEALNLAEDEIRRLLENEFAARRGEKQSRNRYA